MRLYKISEADNLSAAESPDVSATEENRNVAVKKFRDKFYARRTGEEIERVHLRTFEGTLPVRWRSAGDQSCLMGDDRGPLREFETPSEASQDHFLVTPPSHCTSRKVEGFVVGCLTTGGKLLDEL